MGRSTRCVGRSLYNHLKQKNIDVQVEYTFVKESFSWSGTMTVYGNSYSTSKCSSKANVIEALMEQANSHILQKLSVECNCSEGYI